MQENDDLEQQSKDEGGRGGVLDRARGVVGAAKQQASRSAEVLSGADIQRFDEFTDATTRAVVGVHQDQAELREQLARTDRAVDDVRQEQARLADRLVQTERSVQEAGQSQAALLERVEESIRSQAAAEESSGASLSPWTVALGAVSALALLLSIVAIVMSMS